ncbi:MAG: ATP-binding protein, partial [Planctomycetota bacterium]
GLALERIYTQEWLSPGDEADFRAALDKLGYWRGRSRHIARDGRRRLVESSVSQMRDAEGAVIGSLAVIRDVSDQAASEAALLESRARLQFTLDAARIGAWDLDLQSGTARRSARFDHCFGYSEPPQNWTYQIFLAHLHPEDRLLVERGFQEAIDSSGEWHFECRVVWPDNSVHWIEAHGKVFTEHDKPRRMLGIVFDATERKHVQLALVDADKRKDEFLATLAHELRNPLAPISHSLQILRLSNDTQVHERAQSMIERQLAQMVHLVDDLLDVSRISQGKLELRREWIEIATVLQNAIDTSQPLIESRNHMLVLELPERTVLVDADMTRLTQVVSNLLNNAAKYTPDGGRIVLSATFDGDSVQITVTDSGIGIPKAMLPRVFDMFTQINRRLERSQGGLGIGLALVKRLVEMHGGTVAARSEGENQGTSMVLRLPAIERLAPANPSKPAALGTQEAGSGFRVLVVDDNRDSADSLVIALTLNGHVTATAYDGEEALSKAREFLPDAVFLDIGLPGISGYEAARRIRAEPWGKEILLLALSGWGQEEDQQRSHEAGFDQHLVKPVDPSVLTDLLARACGGTRSR